MNAFFGSFGKRFSSVLVVIALVAAGSLPFLFGAEDDEAGICAQALSNCLGSAGGAALAVDWRALAKALLICVAGYDFCTRFIEPYIRDGGRP